MYHFMYVLYKQLRNLGRAKTDMMHISCIFSRDCWKPEHGACSRVAVPTGLCCPMLPAFNQASPVEHLCSSGSGRWFDLLSHRHIFWVINASRDVLEYCHCPSKSICCYQLHLNMLLHLGECGSPLLWLGLVWLQCWHVGLRKWLPSHPECPHSTPKCFHSPQSHSMKTAASFFHTEANRAQRWFIVWTGIVLFALFSSYFDKYNVLFTLIFLRHINIKKI